MKRISTAAIVAACSFSVSSIQAETDKPQEMIVIGARTPISINQLSSSYTIFDQTYLEQRQSFSVAEILRDVPGFAVTRTGVTGGFTEIRVRGSEANHVLVLIDGIEANDISSFDSQFDFAHLSVAQIERIEIIRGGQSALWGSDATAGVINIITKQGSGALSGSAFSEFGSFRTFNNGFSVGGSGDWYHFNLGGSRIVTDGNNIARGGSERDGYENETLSLKAGIKPSKDLAIDFVGRLTDADNDTDLGFPLPEDTDSNAENHQKYGKVQIQYGLFDNKWTHKLSLASTSTDAEFFSGSARTFRTQGRKVDYEYQTSIHFDTPALADAKHTLTLATEHEREDFDIQFSPDRDLTTKSYIGEYLLTLPNDFVANASVRRDHYDSFKNKTTYRISGAYTLPTSSTRIHAAYGTGIKTPTSFQLFGNIPDFTGNPDLEPEESKGWEFGLTQSLFDNSATVTVTYFREKLTDEIDGSGTTVINLDGTSLREGVELGFSFDLTENISASANYTYLDATEPDSSNPGNRIDEIRRPRNTFNTNINYRFLDNRGNINLNINRIGAQTDDDFTTFPANATSLDRFTLVTLSGQFELTDNLTFFGRVENLLDERYEEVIGFETPGIGIFGGVKNQFLRSEWRGAPAPFPKPKII